MIKRLLLASTIALLSVPAEARHGWAWFVANIKSGSHCAGRPTTMYGDGHHNADGSRFNPHGLSAATYDYPFGTVLRVTNCANGRSVHVTVKDRGPAAYQRSLGIRLDLSLGAARAIALGQNGRFESGYTAWEVVSLGTDANGNVARRKVIRRASRYATAQPEPQSGYRPENNY